MNFLPEELENIINDYKYQMEHIEKFQSTLDIIDNITYIESEGNSWRSYGTTTVHCYGESTEVLMYLGNTIYESCHELWIHTVVITPPYMNGDLGEEIETINTIYEEIDGIFINTEYYQEELIDIDDVSEGYQFNGGW
jgi:hypothetical protein